MSFTVSKLTSPTWLGIATGEPLFVVKIDAPTNRVIVGPLFHRERYETRYGLDKMMSVETISARLNTDGIPAEQIDDFDVIADRVAREAGEGDVVLVMSSGAFGGVHEKILERLRV